MRVSDEPKHASRSTEEGVSSLEAGDWADRSRRVLTRDLLVRAGRAQPGERRALQFRALHLNLPVVSEVADHLGLDEAELAQVEHHALDGLLEAVRHYDPYGGLDFTEVAIACVEEQVRPHLPARRRPDPLLAVASSGPAAILSPRRG